MPPDLAPIRLKAMGFARGANPLAGLASLAALLLLWQIAASLQGDFTVLPSPADVAVAFTAMLATGELARHVAASLGRLAAGWSLGAAAGLGIGLAMALHPVVRAAAMPPVSALFALPKIALLPLFIVWLGIGESTKIFTIALGVFSPMVMATVSGIDSVDRGLIRMAQSFDLPPRRIITAVVLPGALPALLTGVRTTASIAVVLLVGAEMIAARHGIGALALTSAGLMRTDRLFVALALLAALGLTFSALLNLAERRLLNWR